MIALAFGFRHSLANVPWWFLTFLIFWLFFVGGSIGSFLNVVIYRLPHGLSITHPGSRCPVCLTPIKWYDNLPLISWCVLGGRCRTCRTAISPRYLFIELLVACLFVGFGALEAFSDGANLPLDETGWRPRFTAVGLWGTYGLQMIMLSTLVAAIFIVYDRYPLSGSMFVLPTAFCFFVLAIFPSLNIVPCSRTTIYSPWIGMMSASAGLLLGFVVGGMTSLGIASAHSLGAIGLFALIGTVLGWQAVLAIGAVSIWLILLSSLLRFAFAAAWEVPWPLYPSLLTCAYIAWWKQWGLIFPFLVSR